MKIFASDINLWISTILPSKKSIHIEDPANQLIFDEPMKDIASCVVSPLVLFRISSDKASKEPIDIDRYDVIIDFTNQVKTNEFSSTKLSFINREDGSMKYIYKKGTLNFLHFFQQITSKDKKRIAWMKYLHALRCDRLFTSGYFTVLWKKSLTGVQYTRHLVDSYSYSSGSKEYGGAPTVSYDLGSEPCFVKFCKNGYTKSLLQNQLIMVGMWKGSGFDSIIIPRIDRYSGSANISIGNHPNEYSQVFTSVHAAFVKEVMDKTIRQYKFFETPQFLAVKHNIELLNTYKTENVPYFKYFSEALSSLKSELESTRTLFSYGYGDFTPWNSSVVDGKIYLFNFSHSTSMHPILFDFFHFVFQNETIVKNKDWTGVKEAIHNQLVESGLIDLIDKWAIDVKLYLKHYLLQVVSQNLGLLAFQEGITESQKKLIYVWKDAMAEISERTLDQRKGIHSDLAHFLNGYSHTFLQEFDFEREVQGPNEIDVLIGKKDQSAVIDFLKEHPFVSELRVVKKVHGSHVFIRLLDGQFILVVLRSKFTTKGIQYIDSKLVLNTSRSMHGILVPDSRVAVEYRLLASAVAYEPISNDLTKCIQSATRAEQEIIQNYLNKKYELNIESIELVGSIGDQELDQIRHYLKRRIGIEKWNFNRFRYHLKKMFRSRLSRGFECTFTELPYQEKYGIINDLQRRLKERYNKEVVVLPVRPGIQSILSGGKRKNVTDVDSIESFNFKKERSEGYFVSVLRYGFSYLDYCIGRMYVKLRFTWRNKIVIYESFDHDLSERSPGRTAGINENAVAGFIGDIHAPSVRINPAKVIGSDKDTVNSYHLERMEDEYVELFIDSFNNKKFRRNFVFDRLNKEQIVQKIMKTLPIVY